jgi:hypothetical protein
MRASVVDRISDGKGVVEVVVESARDTRRTPEKL